MVGTLLNMIATPTMNTRPPGETIKLQTRNDSETRMALSESSSLENDSKSDLSNDSEQPRMLDPSQDMKEIKSESPPRVSTSQDDSFDEEKVQNNSISSQCPCSLWTCSQCSKTFNSARALKIHEVKQHENAPKHYMKCAHCDEVFEHGNLLQIHMKVHHNIQVRCPQCKDMFDHPKALSIHVKAHNSEPLCPVCGVKFDHDKLLKLHMEHYHKVSKKERSVSPSDKHNDHTLQPVAGQISPMKASESPDGRMMNANSSLHDRELRRDRTPSPGHRADRYHETDQDTYSRNGLPPCDTDQEAAIRRETFPYNHSYNPLYHQRLPPMHNRAMFYRPMNDKPRELGPPFALMNYQRHGVPRHIDKRPLGRSHSLPLKPENVYHDAPVLPWQLANTNPLMYGAPREKKIDRATLEAMRNSLKAKLRTVEATLLGEEADPNQPLSPTVAELYEHRGYLPGREELQYRPSVITPRNTFETFSFKRKTTPSDFEPPEKLRNLEQDHEMSRDRAGLVRKMAAPSADSGSREGFSGRFHDASPALLPANSVLNVSIPTAPNDFSFGDQAKIFIKRGAPRCNRCQQTFSSKMEYLHHLISHREKDGFTDKSPEEMELLEDVKRSFDIKSLALNETRHFKRSSTTSSAINSPTGEHGEKKATENPSCQDDGSRVKTPPKPKTTEACVTLSSPSSNPDAFSLGTATCSECKDVFADSVSCKNHIEKRHTKPRCRDCGLTFDHKNLLKIHMDCYHSSLEVLQCYYCGMSFKERREFLDHVTTHEAKRTDNKEKTSELVSESTEQGGRRRWGRLVASAQLPAEKLERRDQERDAMKTESPGIREAFALKSHAKTKLRKAFSLSTYTDMINRQKRSAAEFLRESRSKGDESIGRETRTRIFLPSFEDKMEDMSRFAASARQVQKRGSPPFHRQSPVQDNGEHLFPRKNVLQGQDSRESYGHSALERGAFIARGEIKSPSFDTFSGEKRRLKRSNAISGEDDMPTKPLSAAFRKAFVRDEVETLYQLRHKKSLHCAGVNDSETLDHRNALVKIERVERDPVSKKPMPFTATSDREQPKEPGQEVVYTSVPITSTAYTARKRFQQEVVAPPPALIDVRQYSPPQTSSTANSAVSSDSSPASSRSNSPLPVTKSQQYKAKGKAVSDASAYVSDASETKNQRQHSIKKLTKEALINSLSLKRRASAPDLFQFNQSTDSTSSEKLNVRPGSPSVRSDGTASPVQDTKLNGSKSLGYTPRKQSSRDVTCTQCSVSFGHKKLYKIHLDSYHGKQQSHECLKCGSKDFQNKNEFVKHLMAHQAEGKVDKKATAVEEGRENTRLLSVEISHEHSETRPTAKRLKIDPGNDSGEKVTDHYPPQGVVSERSKCESSAHPESSAQFSQLNNNAKESNERGTTCFTCGKSFENGKQLEQHFSSHASISDDGRYGCVLCGKAFETHRKLEIHSRSHTGFKPHKCELCGRCFPYYSSYYYHKMTHTKDRPHKCPLCSKGFIQTRYLRSHLRTHKDEQGTLSDEVESILRKVELNLNEETDEESVDSPGTAECSPGIRANDEETATAEILCSFKRGLSAQNSDSESPAISTCSD